jgi:hypothetical protein
VCEKQKIVDVLHKPRKRRIFFLQVDIIIENKLIYDISFLEKRICPPKPYAFKYGAQVLINYICKISVFGEKILLLQYKFLRSLQGAVTVEMSVRETGCY